MRKSYKIGNPSHKRYLLVLLGLIILSAVSVFFVASYNEDKTSMTKAVEQEDLVEKKVTAVQGRYLFSGTVVLARAVEKVAAGNYEQPFSQLATFEPEKYDSWLVDLECPVTSNNVSYQQQIDNLVFNCRTGWIPSLSRHFNLINLANNHTNDMGPEGFLETQKNLDSSGIQTVGNYDPAVKKDACEIIALPVRLQTETVENKGSLPVAFCAFQYFFRNPNPGEMDIVSEYAKTMPVFGFMHAGAEYLATAGAEQQKIARSLIDLGSEFVIGNSPHWVQNSEVYKGKPIFYSTGNFIFDQLDNETQRGLSVDVQLKVDYDENVGKWLALGDMCRARGDDCLQTANQQGLSKINLQLVYEPVASIGGNKKITKRADNNVQKAVEERLNWLVTKSQLGQ